MAVRMTSAPIDLIRLTAQIVSAHCANAHVQADTLPDLIRRVHQALATVEAPATVEPEIPTPAVPVKKSVFADHIICLEDGKKLKMLKRHLQTAYGLTPEAYRAKWGLPASYPMVAPAYAEKRSVLAHQIGLGRRGDGPRSAEKTPNNQAGEQASDEPKVTKLPERKRGRPKRTG